MRYFIFMLILILTGCHFTPLYKLQNDTLITKETACIHIESIKGIDGYVLHSELKNLLNPQNISCPTKYNLTVQVSEFIDNDQIIQDDDFSSRARLTLQASFQLDDLNKKNLINTGVSCDGFYNILAQPYANEMAKISMNRQLSKTLAEQIALKIMAHFQSLKVANENSRL